MTEKSSDQPRQATEAPSERAERLRLRDLALRAKPIWVFPNDATGSAAPPCEHPLMKS